MQTINGFGLGYLPDLHDPRDIPFTAAGEVIDLPVKIDLDLPPTVINQGSLGSCTGCSTTMARMILAWQEGSEVLLSCRFAYVLGLLALHGYTLDDYRTRPSIRAYLSDTGAMIRDVVKAQNAFGLPSDAVCHYTTTADFNLCPDARAIAQAKRHLLVDYSYVSTSRQLKEALAQKDPVVLGFSVSSNFGADAQGNMVVPANRIVGGHAVCAVGYDDARPFPSWGMTGGLKIRNSWGTGWGDHGFFWMPYGFFDSDSVSDCWALRKAA